MRTDRGAESAEEISAIFREANERIRGAAEEHAMAQGIPFLCECPEPECTEIIQLSMGEYEAVRSQPTNLLQVPDHRVGGNRVVSKRTGYVVTERPEPATEDDGEVAAS